jgi:hypothetical protein
MEYAGQYQAVCWIGGAPSEMRRRLENHATAAYGKVMIDRILLWKESQPCFTLFKPAVVARA